MGTEVARFATLVAGFAGAMTELIVFVVDVEGVGFVVVLSDPLPTELDTNVITGAALIVVDEVESKVLEILGAAITGITTVGKLLAVVCGAIAVQGGPLAQPLMTN